MWSVYESLLRINSSDVVSHTDSFRNGYYMRIIPLILGSVSDGGCSHADDIIIPCWAHAEVDHK